MVCYSTERNYNCYFYYLVDTWCNMSGKQNGGSETITVYHTGTKKYVPTIDTVKDGSSVIKIMDNFLYRLHTNIAYE